MTVAVAIKLIDAVALAADSATTARDQITRAVQEVTYDTTKIFRLHPRLPIGAITWGLGSIGGIQLDRLLDGDFQRQFETRLNLEACTVTDVARTMHEALRACGIAAQISGNVPSGEMHLLICGFSAGESHSEIFHIRPDLDAATGGVCEAIDRDLCGFYASPNEAIERLRTGFAPALPQKLGERLRYPTAAIIEALRAEPSLALSLASEQMTVEQARQLAEALVATAIELAPYTPGSHAVGGEVQSAILTAAGFKWTRQPPALRRQARDANKRRGKRKNR